MLKGFACRAFFVVWKGISGYLSATQPLTSFLEIIKFTETDSKRTSYNSSELSLSFDCRFSMTDQRKTPYYGRAFNESLLNVVAKKYITFFTVMVLLSHFFLLNF